MAKARDLTDEQQMVRVKTVSFASPIAIQGVYALPSKSCTIEKQGVLSIELDTAAQLIAIRAKGVGGTSDKLMLVPLANVQSIEVID